jgi:hypothetical protein
MKLYLINLRDGCVHEYREDESEILKKYVAEKLDTTRRVSTEFAIIKGEKLDVISYVGNIKWP